MAIAFDVATDGGTSGATSLTWSHTCTGSNLILFVTTLGVVSGTDNVTGITYNGVAMTKINAQQIPSDRILGMWYLIAPATGANNVVVSFSGNFCGGASASYTGAKQSSQPDNSGVSTAASSLTYTQSLTPSADNCWVMGTFSNAARATTADTTVGTSTLRVTSTGGNAIVDNNAAVHPAASTTLGAKDAAAPTAANWAGIMASIAPAVAVVVNSNFLAFM